MLALLALRSCLKALAEQKSLNFEINLNKDLINHWLAGFSDAGTSFQIKILKRNINNTEIRLNFQIDQKKIDLLLLIKDFLGGKTGYIKSKDTYYYDKSKDTYYYDSTSYSSAKKCY
jgi:hypothetical protein